MPEMNFFVGNGQPFGVYGEAGRPHPVCTERLENINKTIIAYWRYRFVTLSCHSVVK